MTPKALIFEKGDALADELKHFGSSLGLNVIEASNDHDLLELLRKTSPDIVLIASSRNKPFDGLESVKQIRRLDSDIPIFFITRYSSESRAIEAFRAGITDYFKWPLYADELMQRIQKSVLKNSSPDSHEAADDFMGRDQPMIGESEPMRNIREYLHRVAGTDSTVLITGETGTGKELAAQVIHRSSSRREKPLVCVNCAALPETLVESELFGYDRGAFTGAVAAKPGKFELAGGGSVFLDEIGDMDPYAQAKLLRCVESKEVTHLGGNASLPIDMRVIAATNQDPEDLVTAGKFRQDLYYRLNVVRVNIPPLREHKEDIPALAAFAISRLNWRLKRNVHGLSDEVKACLMRYDWPGNVRELMNLIEAAGINVNRGKITLASLPAEFQRKLNGSGSSPREPERSTIVSALMSTRWNKAEAARKLNWSRMTLYRKIEKYNIVETRHPTR